MKLSLWSDEDRLFVPRMLGWTINLKFVARRLGLMAPLRPTVVPAPAPESTPEATSRDDRLRRAIARSRYEDP